MNSFVSYPKESGLHPPSNAEPKNFLIVGCLDKPIYLRRRGWFMRERKKRYAYESSL